VVHPPSGWQVCHPFFFQQLMLIKWDDNNGMTPDNDNDNNNNNTTPAHNTCTFNVRTRAQCCQRQLGPNGQAVPVTMTRLGFVALPRRRGCTGHISQCELDVHDVIQATRWSLLTTGCIATTSSSEVSCIFLIQLTPFHFLLCTMAIYCMYYQKKSSL
jgi:hypothetical protein